MSALNPKTISVQLKQLSYPIWIQKGLKNLIDEILQPLNKKQKWFLISPTPIYKLYGKPIFDKLNQNGFNIDVLEIEDGEHVKSIQHFEKYSRRLIDMDCNRNSVLIAFGGGVTGDLCGFIASTLFRGISYFQMPTSLLAMVDSSIGGKTGINIQEGKNLIGAFHHPKAVIIDPEFLNSLPKEEIYSGLGEVIKYGFIQKPEIIEIFKKIKLSELNLQSDEIEQLIFLSVETKANIVSRDSSEKDIRRILNFGHTTGHIIEAFTKYSLISHGEAVVYGMIIAIVISHKYFNLSKKEMDDSISILKNLCKTEIPEIPQEDFYNFLFRDKKVLSQKINFILLNKIGKPIIRDDINPEEIYKTYKNLREDRL